MELSWSCRRNFYFYASYICCCSSKKWLKLVYIYGSYREIKTGFPPFWNTLCINIYIQKYPTVMMTRWRRRQLLMVILCAIDCWVDGCQYFAGVASSLCRSRCQWAAYHDQAMKSTLLRLSRQEMNIHTSYDGFVYHSQCRSARWPLRKSWNTWKSPPSGKESENVRKFIKGRAERRVHVAQYFNFVSGTFGLRKLDMAVL